MADNLHDNVYESKYSMGNTIKLSHADCQIISLANEVVRVMDETWDESNQEIVETDAIAYAKKFTRTGGLIQRFKKHIDFDIDLFDKNNLEHQCEIMKILYLFYMTENKYIPELLAAMPPEKGKKPKKINLFELLSKPSMENIDNSFIEWVTYNGPIIKMIKDSLEKELSPSSANNIKEAVKYIVSSWDEFLENVSFQVSFLASDGCNYSNYEISTNLTQCVLDDSVNFLKMYTLSPVETLYLKMVQHEYMGNIIDILNVNDIQSEEDYHVPSEFVEKMRCLAVKHIALEDINDEKIRELSKYVYLKLDTDKEERRKIKRSIKKVVRWLDFCARAKPLYNMKENVTELFVVSCLQAIILDSSNETFNYIFHGYENHFTPRPQVQGALKNEYRTIDALQIYWVRKVVDRWHTNLDRYAARIATRKLENICDNILIKILSCPSVKEMLDMHHFYYKRREAKILGVIGELKIDIDV